MRDWDLKKGIYPSRIPHDLGFIPHDFAYAVKQKGFFAIETCFISICSKLYFKLVWGLDKVYVSLNWSFFEPYFKLEWGSVTFLSDDSMNRKKDYDVAIYA